MALYLDGVSQSSGQQFESPYVGDLEVQGDFSVTGTTSTTLATTSQGPLTLDGDNSGMLVVRKDGTGTIHFSVDTSGSNGLTSIHSHLNILAGSTKITFSGAEALHRVGNVGRLFSHSQYTAVEVYGNAGSVVATFNSSGITLGPNTSGIREGGTNDLRIFLAGTDQFRINGTAFFGASGSGLGSSLIKNTTASATNPTLCPAQNDQDTGVGSADSNKLSLITGGAERIHISSDGNVGIATNNPTEPLTVAGNIQTSGIKINIASATGSYRINNVESMQKSGGALQLGRHTLWTSMELYGIGSTAAPAITLSSAGITITDATDIVFDTATGTKLGTATTQKFSFWNATPRVQPSSTGENVGFSAGSGTAVNDDSTFTGNAGATAYRINDVVKHLKNIGILAA